MNIKKFQLTEDGYGWDDIAHDDTIRFMVSKDKYFDVKINKEKESIEIGGDNRQGSAQFLVIPHCTNSISIEYY